MAEALTIKERPDGTQYAAAPFPEEIEVDFDCWTELFGCDRVLDLVAINGDPVRYEISDAESRPMIFRRQVASSLFA